MLALGFTPPAGAERVFTMMTGPEFANRTAARTLRFEQEYRWPPSIHLFARILESA